MLENINLAFQGVWSHKLRSFLTMLGIIIGIGAVIMVLCIGGAQRYGKNCLMDAQRMTLIEQNGKKRGENCCLHAIISLNLP